MKKTILIGTIIYNTFYVLILTGWIDIKAVNKAIKTTLLTNRLV